MNPLTYRGHDIAARRAMRGFGAPRLEHWAVQVSATNEPLKARAAIKISRHISIEIRLEVGEGLEW